MPASWPSNTALCPYARHGVIVVLAGTAAVVLVGDRVTMAVAVVAVVVDEDVVGVDVVDEENAVVAVVAEVEDVDVADVADDVVVNVDVDGVVVVDVVVAVEDEVVVAVDVVAVVDVLVVLAVDDEVEVVVLQDCRRLYANELLAATSSLGCVALPRYRWQLVLGFGLSGAINGGLPVAGEPEQSNAFVEATRPRALAT